MSGDEHFLQYAAELSRRSLGGAVGGPFGAVVVRDGRIIGEGVNAVTAINDPTAHAEVVAIRAACTAERNFSLAGATVYTSCEPCPMCLAACYWARVSRIVYAATRAEAAAAGFDDAFIYDEIPKEPEARSMAMEHRPNATATDTLAAWLAKADRIAY
ncbi:MAG: nucleoside deaminase [Chelatococcus sp.]|uniref:nucleoside deaminase n=1 Tax=unclassified Chelatococcus TaxID=2638111 RepID=UPI001BCB5ADE|nr:MULTISPECIES: nucleoside deaminase [unclassified Chelatococcus]CAH1678813.1 Guanine deaminase [Hyphomicrobiales bacterium]MBS7739294.1 nucleoside deaminase [Chelatococcus sp. HY11]MBX3539081.1 nucleoside deaminase [Chelatococcus sp.]MBX3546573.1 nucleoside deaminase [Chelatococcus sp.]MCO5076172.1 nucleoside deaminase [Chelatococcus sp.]